MLPHGETELRALASHCVPGSAHLMNGWSVDVWKLDEPSVDTAVELYDAVLAGGAIDEVVELLEEAGIDLPVLLADSDDTKDDITRSDFCEYLGAATLVAVDGWTPGELFMPNVPKMSRRKSDSGVDLFAVKLTKSPTTVDLLPGEHLAVASVKHTVDASTSGMRWKLAESLTGGELSRPYMAAQLRVLNGQLQREGYTRAEAARAYLFIRDFPDSQQIELIAIGVADHGLEADFHHHVGLLPVVPDNSRRFRMILVPNLGAVHERCT